MIAWLDPAEEKKINNSVQRCFLLSAEHKVKLLKTLDTKVCGLPRQHFLPGCICIRMPKCLPSAS